MTARGEQSSAARLPVTGRRGLLRAAALLGVLLASPPALGGTYLDRAELLIRTARTELDYLEARLSNRELAELVQRLAQGRLDAARDMFVPKEVTQAHPHLMLFLENCERAADAALRAERGRYVTLSRRARDEEEA
ncbi:MAG: hypothetical protein FJ104_14420, partial [Deltaproteobacteria bacterium]|nr:hypothetical protein [Deltaproteobacteria bacterium]